MYQANQQLDAKIKEKKAENETLKMFEPKLAEVNRNMAILQQQLEIQKRIVPEDKDADQFIKLLHDTAATSGIEIRRYTAMPVSNKEFYSEVPFAIDIDGPYYSVLNFFQRVAELERIVNVGNMQMGNTKSGSAAKVKGSYTYAPGETVLASCTATTFFSHEPEEQPAPGPPKPGQPAPAPTAKP
jgi:type IV pilus assembly protein PilO